MAYSIMNRDQHLQNDGNPKRILALDGGGLRGILTLGILQRIEDILRVRHGNDGEFRLCHYFDLIAGTSTGAIIAAALAKEYLVKDLVEMYMKLGNRVFERGFLRFGLLRAKYHDDKLIEELGKALGPDTTLGSTELKTGLLIVTKRLDTGSPWPISNNPKGKYFASRPGGIIENGEYHLWQVVRASTAAPAYFDPQSITIAEKPEYKPVKGEFVDGGVSPFNNPALQAFMYATLDGYNIGWPSGMNKILLVSIGTGMADPKVKQALAAAAHAIKSLVSLMNDCAALQETLLQWMSSSPTARVIDRELGNLQKDLVAGVPVMSYLRYNVDLTVDNMRQLLPEVSDEGTLSSLSEMDVPENMPLLLRLGRMAGEREIRADSFPAVFDLPKP